MNIFMNILYWISAFICICGLIMNMKKSSTSYILWIVGNILMIIVGIYFRIYQQIALFSLYTILSIKGYNDWTKKSYKEINYMSKRNDL